MTGREARRPTVERKIAVILVVAAAVLGLVGFLNIQSTRVLIAEGDWVAHSHLVMAQLEKVLANMGRLESDQRGYLLTGDESYLGTLPGDAESMSAILARLRGLTFDNPRQQALLAQVEPLVDRRLAVRDAMLSLRRREGLDAAVAKVRRNRGRHLMRQMRLVIDRMQRVERRLLAVRSARAEQRAAITLSTITGGSVAALLVLASMGIWVRRDLRAGEQAADELARVSERFNLALAAAQVGTWSWDTTGDVILWDDYIHPLFGLAPGTFRGGYEDFIALVHPDDRAALRELVAHTLAGEAEFATEYRVRWADGSERVVAARGEVSRGADGTPARFTGVCWDVSDEHEARANLRRMKEAADAANQAKSEFLASMSHELRTPMNSIIGFSQLLLRTARSRLDAEDVDALQIVQRNARHLLTLINQVLDLSRVEAGKMTLDRRRLDLVTLAREVVEETRPLLGEKPIRLGLETPAAPVVIEGDATRIRQIVTNLTANALKYTAAGSVVVRVATDHDGELGPVARVSVRDTGPGIGAEDRARLFQRFARLDTDATRREGGTGLGLSVSLELARMHGGRIDVASDGRTGSEFVLTLPVGGRQVAVACVGAGAGDAGEGRTILCVDDDPDVLVFLERTLREAGYRVLQAESRAEALARAIAAEPDLVCVDGDLPDDEGFALVVGLRAHPTLACVPVIMLAGEATERRAVFAGARRFLPKPMQQAALLASVASVFATPVALVLVIDADPEVRRHLRATCERQGIGVATAADAAEARRRLGEVRPDAVVLDPAAGTEGARLVELLHEPAWREIPLVLLTDGPLASDLAPRFGTRAAVVVVHKGDDDVVALVHALTGAAPSLAATPPVRIAS